MMGSKEMHNVIIKVDGKPIGKAVSIRYTEAGDDKPLTARYKTVPEEVEVLRFITGAPAPASFLDYLLRCGAHIDEGDYIVRYGDSMFNERFQVFSPAEFRQKFVSTCTCGSGCCAQ